MSEKQSDIGKNPDSLPENTDGIIDISYFDLDDNEISKEKPLRQNSSYNLRVTFKNFREGSTWLGKDAVLTIHSEDSFIGLPEERARRVTIQTPEDDTKVYGQVQFPIEIKRTRGPKTSILDLDLYSGYMIVTRLNVIKPIE